MPALNWDIFTSLPGSAEKNFELLCRGIVRQNFGSFGVFRALANQPGVEFHLKLDKRCDALGAPGRWWGWQCKWYDLPATGALGATRRKDIEDGVRKAEAHVAGLTDWVLWTRRTLTKDDQQWFNGLSSKMTLHLWTGDEVDNLLTGQAAVLRSTYFGELVLTPDILRERHEQAIAPIRVRWQPDVHHVGEAERNLRRMLGESESWDVLSAMSSELRENAQAVEAAPPVPAPLEPLVTDVIATSRQYADALDRVAEGIRSGDLDLLRDEVSAQPRALPASVTAAPRRLRSGNHRAGLYATNAVAGCHDTVRVFGDVESAFSSRVVAVLAPAGCGKTHLAAQLTTGTPARPHGVLLHGQRPAREPHPRRLGSPSVDRGSARFEHGVPAGSGRCRWAARSPPGAGRHRRGQRVGRSAGMEAPARLVGDHAREIPLRAVGLHVAPRVCGRCASRWDTPRRDQGIWV